MWYEILRFELRQRLRSPVFWLVALAFALMAFAFVTTDAVSIGGGMGNVHRNAPVVVIRFLGVFTVLGLFLVTMFIAGAILRDFNQHSEELVFATPITKASYLGGRFGAGFLAALAVMVAIAVGLLLGSFMPWLDAARLGPTSFAAYGWAFGVIVIPDLLLMSALLFLIASLSRSMLVTYIGLILFFVLQSIAGSLLGDLPHQTLAALLDPFGMSAVHLATRYWSVAQQNTQIPALEGLLLANRAIWLGVALVLLALNWLLFRTNREGLRWRRKHKKAAPIPAGHMLAPAKLDLPKVQQHHSLKAHWIQFFASTRRYVKSVLFGAPFLILLLLGLANLTGILMLSGKIMGTPVYPVTQIMVGNIMSASSMFLWIIIIFYTGELVWRERSLGASEVSDAMPSPNWVALASKLATLVMIIAAYFLVCALFTMGWQLGHGFTHLEPLLYLKGLTLTAISMVLVAVLAVFLQVLANNKFLGYLLVILALGSKLTLAMMHLESNLYSYAGAPGVPYSDMNGFGHFWVGALWFYAYWGWFALALLVATVLLWVRGTGQTWSDRKREAKLRFRRPARLTLAIALVGFVLTGGWIIYNTMVLNEYLPSDEAMARTAQYEKDYAKFADVPQPRITDIKADVQIYPYQRRVHVKGHYTLVNKNDVPVTTLRMRLDALRDVTHLTLDKLDMPAHTIKHQDKVQGLTVYKLDQPLMPGESMPFNFEITYAPKGFTNGSGEKALVHNGSFLHNTGLFPQFGYNTNRQIRSRSKRRKYGLDPDKPLVPPLSNDPAARANTYISHDSDWIAFQTTVCTAGDQLAMAPGHLKREWQTDSGRNCFHYKMDAPMLNFFTYMSARYKLKQVKWKGVTISVYYNPAHYWNVDRMIKAAKKSLDYYNRQYTTYQFDQLRILEVPDYHAYAQSFANTVAFSEGIGFIADLSDKSNLDYVTQVTAHEIAHQWWAHRVIGADMQGATMLSESLAEYSSLMVMQELYGKDKMHKYLKYELDKYLRGRTMETNREQPLAKVEGQGYIRYRKGAMIFYALQDYVGVNTLDAMLKQFLIDKGFQKPPYTNSNEFMAALSNAVGPQWQNVLQDWFWKITLYDNRVTKATATKAAGGGWDVTMEVHTGKTWADGEGKETDEPFDIPVDIGVFGQADSGKEEDRPVLYLKRRHVTDGDSSITIHVAEKPFEVGIDPYNKLIDRVSGDNRMQVSFP